MNSSPENPSPFSTSSMDSLVCSVSGQSHMEEIVNSITHGIGLLLSIVGLAVLAIYSGTKGDVGLFVCCSIFGSTMVLTYASSTLYHSAKFHPGRNAKRKLQLLDHASIYLLIAGSYTPFTLLVLDGSLGWGLFVFAWGVAIVGIVLKFLMTKRRPLLETLMYLGMGWAAVLAVVPLHQTLPTQGFYLLMGGGLFYSLGTFFYLNDRIPYNHGIWHLFVLGGSACHFFSVYVSLFD